jgi:uncharacterized ferritin-like protein (DUF455 family)
MELREFAEQVVFARTLEEKLACPGMLTDDQPGPVRLAPVEPGRPVRLLFKDSRDGGGDAPKLGQLDQEETRGRLLHFFANHELLATELMALVLLRFPDAPPSFRQGVLRTLRDEQEHTRLYVDRMRACGIEFGDLPVSGYFWRAVSPMENPIDFVSRLSLTFEQANLDHCREFGRRFAAVGDQATAGLLEGIYRDEIAHVAHGLKWFRRWKNPAESDWEAFCRQLHFPLSPQRAKGPVFNSEGRRAAGLDADFIGSLEVYARSRGRTPGVFVFNPFSGASIESSVNPLAGRFQPTRDQEAFTADLAGVCQFLGRRDDVALVPSLPSPAHQAELQRAGFPVIEFIALQDGKIPPHSDLRDRKLGALRPWCWGPDSVELLESIAPQVTGGGPPLESRFHPGIAELHSKSWSAAFLRSWLERHGSTDKPSDTTERRVPLCRKEDAGIAARTVSDALELIRSLRTAATPTHRLVVKEEFGFAGGGQIRLWEPELLPTQRRWMESAFDRGATLVIEPWLDRVRDFSVQLEQTAASDTAPGTLRLLGFTGLVNDLRGQFQANWADPDWNRRVPNWVIDAWKQGTPGAIPPGSAVAGLFQRLIRDLEPELQRRGYVGPLGLDALVYRDAAGAIRLKPVLELNPRFTMGRLTLELMTRVAPGCRGVYRLVSIKTAARAGFETFDALAERLRVTHPVRLAGEPIPKMEAGIVCLNDSRSAQRVLALWEVGESVDPSRAPWESAG